MTGSAVLAARLAFFLAELRAKMMLATITMATDHGLLATWAGGTAINTVRALNLVL